MLKELEAEVNPKLTGNFKVIGKTKLTKLSIQLYDDTTITYRPYDIAFSKREKGEIIVNLLHIGIIRESFLRTLILHNLQIRAKNGEKQECIDYRHTCIGDILNSNYYTMRFQWQKN